MRVLIDDNIWNFDLTEALQHISTQRREQALQFRHELGQRQCVLSYLLLKRALHEVYGIDENPLFSYGEHGKPFLTNHHDIHFNISHCKDAVACAIDDSPVGIDIESVGRYKDELARYTMNDEEIAKIAAAEDPEVVFIELWTKKEAATKLVGTGITDNLKEILTRAECVIDTTVSNDRKYVWSVATSLFKKN